MRMRSGKWAVWTIASALGGAWLLATPGTAGANCNLIPAAPKEFRSTLGTVDRTIAAPGQRLAVRVDLACNPTAPGFDPVAANNVVTLRFVPPGSDGNPALATELPIPAADVTPANCATAGSRCDTLLLSFPDAGTLDAALAPGGDGRGPTGPVRIRVENLAATVLADIGPLFEPTLGCTDEQPESVFGHLTAIPTPNSFGNLANATDTTLEATIDGNGDLLVPVDYSSVLPSGPGSAVFRILEGTASIDAFTSNPGVPIAIPGSRYLRSFNLAGRPIPPVLETTGDGSVVLGSVDAQVSVLRVARLDPDAPGPPLYDLSDRLENGRGPVLITGAAAEARESAPLSTLSADPSAITFARLEGLEGDLDGDGDSFDRVPQVIEVSSGAGVSTGLAVTEVTTPNFARPVLASGDGFVAFGASEGRQGYASLNGDGDVMDNLLRVFDATGSPLATGTTAIDPMPVVNGKPLAISNGLVFFRTRESDAALRQTEAITPTLENQHARGDSTEPALSRDGRYVAFLSLGGSTFGAGFPSGNHVFVYDRTNQSYELIDRDGGGIPVNDGIPLGRVALSADGRLVFYSHSSNSLPGADVDGGPGTAGTDTFVYDRQTQTTTCATCSLPNGNSAYILTDASDDGRFLLLQGGSRLDRQTNQFFSVLAIQSTDPEIELQLAETEASMSGDGRYVTVRVGLRFIQTGAIVYQALARFDLDTLSYILGPPGSATSTNSDGSAIAFMSDTDLVTDDTNLATDAYVWINAGDVEQISVDTNGQQGFGGLSPRRSSISDDGRYVAYINDSGHEVPGVPSNRQVFRVDRATNVIEAVSVSSGGAFGDGMSNYVAISGDGRSVAVGGFSQNLAPDLYDVQNIVVRGDAGGTSLNAADLDAGDTVLQIYDTATQSYRSGARVPADVVKVAAGRAALLSSEAADGAQDLNGDLDATDTVARVADGASGAVSETGLAADAIALSDQVLCIAVNERAQGLSDLNGDGDLEDSVLFVRNLATNQQVNTGFTVNPANLAAAGTHCVFTTPEASVTPSVDLNGDGDTADDVLGVYDDATAIGASVPYATEDLVASGDLVAFRVCEGSQGLEDLNFDGDVGAPGYECVMHVLHLSSGAVENTQRAADTCRLPGCDPFFEPYRVTPSAVSFLTSEFAQTGFGVAAGTPLAVDCNAIAGQPGFCDLSGDGDNNDSMISVYNVRSGLAQLIPLQPPNTGPGQDVPPFPTEIGDSGVLYVQLLETQVGEDVNGDGQITDTPVLVLVGDADGDGTLDDSVNRNDTCVEVANPDQLDADRDQLGDGACDPAPTPSLPGDVICDVDSNGRIDSADVDLIFGDRGAKARASDPRDADGDGAITVLDVSLCRAQCSYASCKPGAPTGGGGSCGLGAELVLVLGTIELARRRVGRRQS